MPLDNDGNDNGSKDSSNKGTKGPWGGGSNRGRRSIGESAKDSRGKKDEDLLLGVY